MDKIINILLLVIIFVFDPLAISLVVAANFAFEKAYPKKQENLYGEKVLDLSPRDISTIVKASENLSPPNETLKKAVEVYDEEGTEERMKVIGQNGNTGEHYQKVKEVTTPSTHADRYKRKDDNNTKKTYM